MAGWRGPQQGSSIPMTKHGSGGFFGGQLSGTLQTANSETGDPNVSNTATLPNRGPVVVQQFTPPSNMPGAMYGVPGALARRGYDYNNGLPGGGGSRNEYGKQYGNPDVATEYPHASGGHGAIPNASGEPSVARRQPFVNGYYPGFRSISYSGVYPSYRTGDISPGDPPHGGGHRFAQDWDSLQGTTGGEAPGGGPGFRNIQADGGGGVPGASWNDKLWATDRHGIMNTGTERGGGRGSGQTDPPMDGPPRPALRLVQRTINWQQGNPLAHTDHEPGEQRNYSMSPPAQRGWSPGDFQWLPSTIAKVEPGPQYVGEQGIGWSSVYGGVPGLWQPYGSYAGYTAGPIKGIQSPAEEGSANDGPQKVFGGIPHGLHSNTYPDYSTTLGRYMAIPQHTLPRQDRPSNATGAGQSYNQTVVPQGQTGTVGVQQSGNDVPGATQSQAWRTRQSMHWRGIRPGGGQT